MSCFKFNEDDIFINTIRAEPQYSFYIYSGSIYIDSVPHLTGTKASNSNENIYGVPNGHISLYEYNIDRLNAERIYPFVYKDGKRNSFKVVTETNYETQYDVGDVITSAYNMSASISVIYRSNLNYDSTTTARKEIIALRNTLDHYAYLSPHYEYSSSFGNKQTQPIRLVSIPSIFYGSKIKKGTVRLDYYYSGSLLASLEDNRRNGELIQVSGAISANDGKIAGVVLYNEGFVVLTGSWDLMTDTIQYSYVGGDSAIKGPFTTQPSWVNSWGHGTDLNINSTFANVKNFMLSSSFGLEYSGSTETQVMTLLAHAPYDELNYSNNPTSYSASAANKVAIGSAMSGAHQYIESPIEIKNVVSASYTDQSPPFEKVTYITKVAVYDENKNLIGIAKLATPVRKTEDIDYTFKIKLDI